MGVRTTVRLPPDLMRAAKRKAFADGTTLTSLIEAGLRTVLADAPPRSPPRLPVPVSRARGGLMPGIDLARLDDIDAEADLAALSRSR